MHREIVLGSCKSCDVKSATDERTGDIAELLSVEPDVCLVVDAVEEKFETLLRKHFVRYAERASVPPVLSAKVFRYGQIVQTVIRIRIYALIYQSPEDCTGYCGVIPVVSHHFVSLAHFPSGSDLPDIVCNRTEHCLGIDLGYPFRHLYRYRRLWKGLFRLRRRQTEVCRQQLLVWSLGAC